MRHRMTTAASSISRSGTGQPASIQALPLPSAASLQERRFTLDGDSRLEKRLGEICAEVVEATRAIVPAAALDAIVLGGGYGRGEGGVHRKGAVDEPYNDLEFYVFTRGNRLLNQRRFTPPLLELGERLSRKAGLHVEFKVDSLRHLRQSEVTMFSYDLVSGHRLLVGGENTFAHCEHHRDPSNIPVFEATRLLLNRCTGLLLAKEFLLSRSLDRERSDFVGRNLAKAKLALGDALLAAFHRYHWSCVERAARVRRLDLPAPLPWLDQVRRWHEEGVAFKLRPQRRVQSAAAFLEEHGKVSAIAAQVWLWLESRRLGVSFQSMRQYAFDNSPKSPHAAAWRNALLNARCLGWRALLDRGSLRYPRERLLRSLPLLLWDADDGDLIARRFLQKQLHLRSEGADWQSLVTAYKRLWSNFA